jgi:Fe-S-cluster containining protein
MGRPAHRQPATRTPVGAAGGLDPAGRTDVLGADGLGTVTERRGTTREGTQTASETALAALGVLHAELPALECLGLCEASCGEHVDASHLERRRLLAVGVDLDAPTPDGACPALSRAFGTGRCRVHEIRPTICRLWGATASMPCPHGCTPPGGLVDDASALRWIAASMEIGGHDAYSTEMMELLDVAVTDPATAALFARFLRGDRTITAALWNRLNDLRTLQARRV